MRAFLWIAWLTVASTVTLATQGAQGTMSFPPRLPFPTAPPIQPPPTSQPPPLPGSKAVLQASDLTYVGAIRMPDSGVDTTFAYGGMTGRVVNGRVRLFLYGNTLDHDQVYELEDPGVDYATDYRFAPRARLVTAWGDIYHGKRITYDASGMPISPGFLLPGDLYWNANTRLLYWTYFDSYNVSHNPDWALGATSLDDAASGRSTAYGPWRTAARDADNNAYYGAARCLYLFNNPLDGTMMCGSPGSSGSSTNAWGPDAYGGLPWPVATTPTGAAAPNLNLSKRYLEHYFMGNTQSADYVDSTGMLHGRLRAFRRVAEQPVWENYASLSHTGTTLRVNPALNRGIGSWTQSDSTNGAIWLELGNKHGVIFDATLVGSPVQDPNDCVDTAHEWYANAGVNPPSGACSHGCIPPDITGPVFTAAFPAFVIYDPDVLQLVSNGILPDYSVEPAAVIDLERTYHIQTAAIPVIGAAKTIRGFYFDAARNYLFVLAARADDTRGIRESLIHVFAVRD